MSILDVTEDQIFQTLGKGKDPNFKPIEKVRPVITRPKKTYMNNNRIPAVKKPVEVQVNIPVAVPAPQTVDMHADNFNADESVKKLEEDLNELNNRVAGLQKMVKWYILPQFVVVIVLILALVIRS